MLGVVLLVAAVAAPAAADPGRAWQRPVGGAALREFAVAADRFATGQHRGVDLAARPGAPVRAACGGRVSFAGRVPGGGRTVSVRCGALVATYQHLGLVVVRRGAVVARGGRLGAVGRSGSPWTHRAHLHLGAREAATGRYVDPMTLLAAAPGPAPPSLPPARGRRRPPPLGAAPRRPQAPPLGVAPSGRAARPVPMPRTVTPSRPPTGAAPAPAPALPWVVWLGLACVGLGLPVGALVRVRCRRRRPTSAITATAPS